jgi:hypothetical protein
MKLLRRISRAITRFTDWLGPRAAAGSMVHGSGTGGTQVDPAAIRLLENELDRDRSDEPPETGSSRR